MNCPQCGGTTNPKVVNTQTGRKQVFECNQDNGDCLNDKGYPTSVWPKGRSVDSGRGDQQAVRRQATSSPPSRSRTGDSRYGNATTRISKDEYWTWKQKQDIENKPRIERQHSQHMALLMAAIDNRLVLNDESKFDTKKFCELVSWCQRDINRSPERVSEVPEDKSGDEYVWDGIPLDPKEYP